MTYRYAVGGDGWVMVPCMIVFLAEVEHCVELGLLDVTNLGQLGDARHQAEPTSRHNPAQAPNGFWYVCAADFGGADYAKLAYFHQAMYRAHDPRVYSHGFSQRGDGYGLSWPDGGWEWTDRDQGHCHFDVTMRNGSLGSGTGWWVDSLNSTAPWGLEAWLRNGHLSPQSGNAAPIQEDDDMPFTEAQLEKIVHDEVLDVVRSKEFTNLLVSSALDGCATAIRNAKVSIANAVWSQVMRRDDLGPAGATNFLTAILADTRKIIQKVGA